MAYYRITAPVDCKNPAWQSLLDAVIATGTAKTLRGVTPDGLPDGGYWEYRKRVNGGRVYLMYNVQLARGKKKQRTHVIGSVNPEYAQQALAWKPKPNDEHRFDFESGPVIVHYDALALPAWIWPLRIPCPPDSAP